MRKLLLIMVVLFPINSLLAQSAVRVPHAVDPRKSTDKWLVTEVINVQQARGRFIESKTLKGAQFEIFFHDFHFTIPAGAAIKAIDVRIARKKKGSSEVKDQRVSLLKPVNDSEANGNEPNLPKEVPWSDGLATVLYSFPPSAIASDGFSFLWTAEDINQPSFGLLLGTSIGGGKGAAALIDKVELTVRYTEPMSSAPPEHFTEKKPLLKNLGRRYEVNVEKEGDYQFIVRNSTGHIVQQTTIQGGRPVIVPLNDQCKGRCIITIEGRDYKKSVQALLQ